MRDPHYLSPWEAIRERSVVVRLVSLFWLNILDGALTVSTINQSKGLEINPLMGFLLDLSPTLFLITKITLVSLCLLFVYRYRHLKIVRISVSVLCVIYLLVCCWGLSILLYR